MPHLEHDAKLLSPRAKLSRGRLAVYGGLTAIVGVVVVVVIFAATGSLALEAESGTLAGTATVATVSGASGGEAVQFGSGNASTPTPTPQTGWPDATNTGVPAGTTLHSCASTITQPGTYSDCSWTDGVSVQADNVTIEDSTITASGEQFGIDIVSSNNLVVDHVTITSPSASGAGRLLAGIHDHNGDSVNPHVIACNISHTSTGVQFNNGLVQDNYIHDMGLNTGDHINGQTSNAGSHVASEPLIIRHNAIFNQIDQTDAISLFEDFGGQDYATIDDNLVAGGGYAIYGGQNENNVATHDIHITNNHFSTRFYPNSGSYGPVAAWNKDGVNNTFSGNVWEDGPNAGKAVAEPQGY